MISLEAVSKRYGSKIVVENLTFEVQQGEILGFLGPNGAGKTTTLRMIAGFITATTGTVTVAGLDMATQNLEAARRIGYLPEHPPLYDTLDVAGYLRFVAKAKGIRRAEIPAELDRVSTACRLEAVFRSEIFKLSKGYRQRVGLAQSLLGKPEVLLLDEPTIGLDPGQLQETREVIRSFGRAHTVMLSTHILAEVSLICQRVAIIHQGRLLAIDTPSGLQRAMQATNRVVLEIVAPQDPLRETLMGIDGVKAVTMRETTLLGNPLAVECDVEQKDGVEAAIARAVSGKWELYKLERQDPTLENIFLYYIRSQKGQEAA